MIPSIRIARVQNYCWDVTMHGGNGGWCKVEKVAGGAGPGGGLTDTELRAAPLSVSGSFWQAVQPVSGVFWQAVQPVSGPLTDTQLRVAAVAVSGTFWQATQPVSGTFWQATQPVSGPVTDAQLRATPVPVSIGASTPLTFVSAKTAAPALNSVQCDTGPLAAGNYEFDIHLACADTIAVGKGLVIEHRNAANATNVNVLGGCVPGDTVDLNISKLAIALNERIRVIAGTAAGAAASMYISAIGRRLT